MSEEDALVLKKLSQKYALFKSELANLITDKDHLSFYVSKNVEAAYYLKIGIKEYDLLIIKEESIRIRRRIQLIQTLINKKERPDLKAIEKQLDRELSHWIEQINDLNSKIQSARIQLDHIMGFEDALQLKRLYRELVRLLHPDLIEVSDLEYKNLWFRTTEAFRKRDLEELKILTVLSGELNPDKTYDDQAILQNNMEVIKKRIHEYIAEIRTLKSKFPLSIQDLLRDENWVNDRFNSIEIESQKFIKERSDAKQHLSVLYLQINE